MDRLKEAIKLASHLNGSNSYTASLLPDSAVKVLVITDGESFTVVLEPCYTSLCYYIDTCLSDMNLYYHKRSFAMLTLELSKYNVAMNKRLSK